jgi:hypothetical protein
MPAPIRLADSQLAVVMAAAEVLAPADRSALLEAVAAGLRDREVGDGLLHRVMAEVQRRYFAPPELERAAGQPKWR